MDVSCPNLCEHCVRTRGKSKSDCAAHGSISKFRSLTGLQNPAPKQLSSVSIDITARKEELKMRLLSHGIGHARDWFNIKEHAGGKSNETFPSILGERTRGSTH